MYDDYDYADFNYQHKFLRVLYTETGALGYMARDVATFIMKPIQGAEIFGPAERASALNSQVSILFRRGMLLDACKMLWDATVPFAASVSMLDGGFAVPKCILKKSFLDGGLDLGHPLTLAVRTIATAPLPTLLPESEELEAAVGSEMTDDWIRVISDKVKEAFDAPAVADCVHASNIKDSLRPEDRVVSLRALEKQLKIGRDRIINVTGERSTSAFTDYLLSPASSLEVSNSLAKLKTATSS